MAALQILGVAALWASLFFYFIGILGMMRFRSVYNRLHAGGVMSTLGLGFLVIGAILLMPSAWPKLVILMLFVLITSPAATHSIAQTAYRLRYRPDEVGHSIGNGDDSTTPAPLA